MNQWFKALLLSSLASSLAQAATLNTSQYDVYYGDINQDGFEDIYLKGKPLPLIIAGQIDVPIIVPAPESMVLYRDTTPCQERLCTGLVGLDQYLPPEALTLSDAQFNALVMAEPGVDFIVGDINGDGREDWLIRGINGSPALSLLSNIDADLPTLGQSFSEGYFEYDINDRGIQIALLDTNGDGRDDLVFPSEDEVVADIVYEASVDGQINNIYEPTLTTQPQTATMVGLMTGNFSVGETGDAKYTIALKLPKGTAGVTPELGLSFSSRVGNGLLGEGWGLTGLSSITRCRQTLLTDGQAKPINFDANDRFCMDGQRLIVTQGQYGAVGAQYRTELDRYTIIRSIGGTYGHPLGFEVLSKDGVVTVYGNGPGANQLGLEGDSAPIRPITARQKITWIPTPKTMTWALSEKRDSVGNKVQYRYHNDPVDGYRLQQIDYAFGYFKAPQARARVVLSYEQRPDIITAYSAGYQFATRTRLSHISVNNYINDQWSELRRYDLHYLPYDPIVGHTTSYLGSVQECAGDHCLPATHFDWQRLPQLSFQSGQTFNLRTLGVSGSWSDRHVAGQTINADINGDGLMDLIWLYSHYKNTNHRLYYALSDGQRLNHTPFAGGENLLYWEQGYGSAKIVPIDYNSDGFQDIAIFPQNDGSPWRVYLSVESDGQRRLSSTPISLSQLTDRDIVFADLNADGLVDALVGNQQYIMQKAATPTVDQPYTFGSPQTIVWQGNDQTQSFCESPTTKHYESIGDVDGDGIVDVVGIERQLCTVPDYDDHTITTQYEHLYILANRGDHLEAIHYLGYREGRAGGVGSRYLEPLSHLLSTQLIDINNDGLVDLMRIKSHGNDWNDYYFAINTGKGFAQETYVGRYHRQASVSFQDINQDGAQDLVYHEPSQSALRYRPFTQGEFKGAQTIRSASSERKIGYQWADLNGDGFVDLIGVEKDYIHYWPSQGTDQPVNHLVGITNGLGAKTEIQYQSLANSDRYQALVGDNSLSARSVVSFNLQQGKWPGRQQGLDSQLLTRLSINNPILPINGGMNVVTTVTSDKPEAGNEPGNVNEQATISVDYYYAGARVQGGGRGFLGFEQLTSIDGTTGIATTTRYRQDYPFVGAPDSTEVRGPNGELIKQSFTDWHYRQFTGTDNTHYYQTLMAITRDDQYRVTTDHETPLAVGSSIEKRLESTYQYDDYGNVLSTEEAIYQGASLQQSKRTEHDYGQGTLTLYGWGSVSYPEMGRLVASSVTVEQNGKSTTRETAFSYYEAGYHAGLLHTETIEPNSTDPALTLTQEHFYDSFGNKVRTVSTGWDGSTISTRSAWQVYDDSGRYIDEQYNSYDQRLSKVLARDAYANPISTLDVNGVTTTHRYDALGREIERSDSTGAWARTAYQTCQQAGGCPSGTAYAVTSRVSGGGQSKNYFDKLGRSIRQSKQAFDGRWQHIDSEYHRNGQIAFQSTPYFAGQAHDWTRHYFDLLAREVRVQAPDGSMAYLRYDGPRTTSTNHFGHVQVEERNGLGQLAQVIDNLGGQIRYTYNIDGELETMTSFHADSRIGSVTTLEYDRLGRKMAMHDRDKGHWQYQYNAFGELISQTDAKGQRSDNTYDALGRVTTRADYTAGNQLEQITRWQYNNEPGQGAGQLTEVLMSTSINGACDSSATLECIRYSYDQYGRVTSQQTTLRDPDNGQLLGEFVNATEYDSIGRVLHNFDALNGYVSDEQGLINSGVTHHYNAYGYQEKVTDIHSGKIIEQTLEQNARGQTTQQRLLNGATTYLDYDPTMGRLIGQRTGVLGLASIQEISYQWDELGNLRSRHNQSAGKNLQESFCYDGLNRLIKSHQNTLQGGCSLSEADYDQRYDSLGNITYKYDVGEYSYGREQDGITLSPHAVTATSDGHRYEYDNNGNMIVDLANGVVDRTFTYSTFDKPIAMTRGGHTTRFAYNNARSRYWRQDTDQDGVITTTVYLSGVERISKSDSPTVEWKRYLGPSIITHHTDADGNITKTDTRVVYKDHLGSTDVITDELGQVIQAMSFDAWGQRRDAANWQAFSATQLVQFDSSESTKGFTGHEHVDEIGIIHMNGRIYDPRLARFLQADPHVQAPTNTQSLNRYSYVWNNPLNKTDPSGYFAFGLMMGLAIAGASTAVETWLVFTLMAMAGTMDALVMGATLKDAVKSGLISGVSAAAFTEIGNHFKELSGKTAESVISFGGNELTKTQVIQQITAHAMVGGITSVAQGGKFGHGFISAGLTKGVMGFYGDGGRTYRLALHAVLGGTVSEISGGKFSNGAQTAAFQFLFNELGRLRGVSERERDEMKNKLQETEEQRELRLANDVEGYYEARAAAGDAYAARALMVVRNECTSVDACIMATANFGLHGTAFINGVDVDTRDVQIRLMNAHANAVALDQVNVPGLLSPEQITVYHHQVFLDLGLPKATFGGTPVTGQLWEVPVWTDIWCKGCDIK